MDTNMQDPFPGSGVSFWSIMAALAGALLSFRMLAEASPMARGVSVFSSFLFAFFVGPAIAEYLNVSLKTERAIMLLVAFAGVNLLAGVWVAGQKWKQDPRSVFEWVLSLLPKFKTPEK